MTTKHGKIALFVACCLITLCGCSALADGLRITSQFGNGNVWPYRQATPCNRAGNTNACGQSAAACGTSSCGKTCGNAASCAKGNCSTGSCGTCTKRGCCKTNQQQNTPAKPTTPPTTDGHYTIGSASAQEQEAWKYINQDRQRDGLAALPLDESLCALARMKSQDMLTNRYFAHTSPTLGDAATMLRSYGYRFSSVGENIARYGTVAKAHVGLMNSDGHRRNILSSSWTRVGIGVVQDSNGFVYITQLFAR